MKKVVVISRVAEESTGSHFQILEEIVVKSKLLGKTGRLIKNS
jgi:hypothetical protein